MCDISSVEKRVRTVVGRFRRLLVAYSGGLDSSVLLSLAARFGRRKITAVHVNHGLHPDSDSWQSHCEQHAERLGVGFVCRVLGPLVGNVEMAARTERYEAWSSLLHPGDGIAIAHHADDVDETRMWQLLTGRAVVGVPRERELGQGTLVRPFLDARRETLRRHAIKSRLSWLEDPSNEDTTFDRNWIRRCLFPELDRRFPQFRTSLESVAPEPLVPMRRAPMRLDSLFSASVEGCLRGIRGWLAAYGEVPSNGIVQEVLAQAQAGPDRTPEIRVSDRHSVCRYGSALHVVAGCDTLCASSAYVGESCVGACGRLEWVDADWGLPRAEDVLLRSRTGEDRVRSQGATKRVSRLFQEHGVAPWLRDRWPVVELSGRVAAVPNIAADPALLRPSGLLPVWFPNDGLWQGDVPRASGYFDGVVSDLAQ